MNVTGSATEVRAKVVDTNELGLGVETDCRLEPNAVLTVDGQVGHPGSNGKARARVIDCKPFHGVFRTGLIFESGAFENGNGAAARPPKRFPTITNCCRSVRMPIPT